MLADGNHHVGDVPVPSGCMLFDFSVHILAIGVLTSDARSVEENAARDPTGMKVDPWPGMTAEATPEGAHLDGDAVTRDTGTRRDRKARSEQTRRGNPLSMRSAGHSVPVRISLFCCNPSAFKDQGEPTH